MLYKVLADIVVLVHFLWIVFLVFGAFWGRGGVKKNVVKVIHVSALGFALILHIFNWYCPLTHVEVYLRSKHDPVLTYTGSFIAHYAERVIYVALPPWFLLVLTVFLCGFNAWFYLGRKR